MAADRRVVFLPGAGGGAEFWSPVAEQLPGSWTKLLLSWPGAGAQPHDPAVRGFGDLVSLAAAALTAPSDVVAHSMGGAVAIALALAHPEKVRRLVLSATSGGIDAAGLGGADWRDDYRREYPGAAPWMGAGWPDYTHALAGISTPTLLLWSDDDPISPVAIGEHLAALLPCSKLHVITDGGGHQFAHDRADAVAAMIAAHLG